MKKILTSALFAISAVLGSAGAQASMITQWEVKVDAVFDTSSVVWDHSNGGTLTDFSVSTTSLRWGQPSTAQSGLAIGNSPVTTYVDTNGAAVNNITLTHTNRPITGTTLDSVSILSTLTLTPSMPSLTGLPPATMFFAVNFQETTNDPRPGLCADGGLYGIGVNGAGCADIFVISQDSLNFEFQYYDPDLGADRTYYISFFEATNGLGSLSSAACSAAGAGFPCLGFETSENQETTARFAALITTEPVSIPEPGSMALLGMALAAAGLIRSRKI